jgi:hypothetical protein
MKQPVTLVVALLISSTIPVVAGQIMAPPPDLASLLLAIVVYGHACFFTGVFGLPTYLLFERFGWARWWSATVVGMLGGAVVGAFVWKPYGSLDIDVPVMSATGAVTALVFWAVVRRAERSSPPIRLSA